MVALGSTRRRLKSGSDDAGLNLAAVVRPTGTDAATRHRNDGAGHRFRLPVLAELEIGIDEVVHRMQRLVPRHAADAGPGDPARRHGRDRRVLSRRPAEEAGGRSAAGPRPQGPAEDHKVHHISPRHADPISTRSAFAGRSALSQGRSSGEPGAAGRGSKRSGRAFRRPSNCRRSSGPQQGARCVAPALAASPSNRPSLSLVYKSVTQKCAFR